jgi:hypothetical protein
MHVSRRSIFAAILMTSTVLPAHAAGCDSAAHRAFDFWVGDWQVHKTDGTVAGHNKITREYGGCVVHEHYTTDRGYSGESLNIYDAARGVWHQTWVDSGGTLLTLEGGMRDGKMVLEGELVGKDGKVVRQRITWTPNTDGTVRQFWESMDAQGNWTTAFDGTYSRR